MSRVADNLTAVRQRIAAAAQRSGRSPSEITLVAVTKYAPDEAVFELIEAGCLDLGESRPQALWQRSSRVAERFTNDPERLAAVRWHFIGHLQRNKVDRTLPLASLIHSADSVRLLQAIDEAAKAQARTAAVLLEVNVSGDATKHGFIPDSVAALLPPMAALTNVSVRGLMCMAARERDGDVARQNFAALRKLRDALRLQQLDNVSLDILSMGMSGDYELALEEGATHVRVGSALFEGVSR